MWLRPIQGNWRPVLNTLTIQVTQLYHQRWFFFTTAQPLAVPSRCPNHNRSGLTGKRDSYYREYPTGQLHFAMVESSLRVDRKQPGTIFHGRSNEPLTGWGSRRCHVHQHMVVLDVVRQDDWKWSRLSLGIYTDRNFQSSKMSVSQLFRSQSYSLCHANFWTLFGCILRSLTQPVSRYRR